MQTNLQRGLRITGPSTWLVLLVAVSNCPGQFMGVDAISTPAEVAAEKRIRAALEEPADFDLIESPLSEFVAMLSTQGIPARLDLVALDQAGLDRDEPITWQPPSSCSRRAGLAQILEPLGLTWCIRHETLLVTTPEQAEQYLKVRLYDITQLISVQGQGETADGDRFTTDSFMEALVAAIETDSWNEYGGSGCLRVLRAPEQAILVVSHTDRVHEKISRFITVLTELLN